jgi:DNA-binding FadR family transcriptional regulator
MLVEPEVCRLAALNASSVNLKEMRDLVQSYAEVKKSEKKDERFILFHRLVGRACGNPLYAILMESIMDFTAGFIKTIRPVEDIIHGGHDHDIILAALEQRDPQKAAVAAARHASQILESMRRLEKTYLALLKDKSE